MDIHKNEIEDIGNYFDREKELEIHTMDISFNKLTTITAKSIPDKIQTISLNDNAITRIDPLTFSGKKHLVRVDLYANQIVKLESSSIRLPPRDLRSKKQRPMFYFGKTSTFNGTSLELFFQAATLSSVTATWSGCNPSTTRKTSLSIPLLMTLSPSTAG